MLYGDVVLSLNQILQSERIDGLVVRPSENLVVKFQLGVGIDLAQQVPPFLLLT